MHKLELFEEEKKIWYSKYFYLPLEEATEADRKLLSSPMDPGKALPIESFREFIRVKDTPEEVETGYCVGPDGHGYLTCTMYYSDITPDMIDWWMGFCTRRQKGALFGHGNLRYKIWSPYYHWDHSFLEPGNPASGLYINEIQDLDDGTMDCKELINRGVPPTKAGVPEELIAAAKAAGYYISMGNTYRHGQPTGFAVNVMKPTPEGGCKWQSVSWKGYYLEEGKPVAVPGEEPPSEKALRGELMHNILERRHLKAFLKELYGLQHNKPLDED